MYVRVLIEVRVRRVCIFTNIFTAAVVVPTTAIAIGWQ